MSHNDADSKKELLRRRLQAGRRAAGIPKLSRDGEAAFASSFAQERLWLLRQIDEDTGAYNLAFAVDCRGPLDVERLHRAIALVVAKHESLRTTFREHLGRIEQVVHPNVDVTLPVVDVRGALPEEAREREAEVTKELALGIYDLERGPLVRSCVVRKTDVTFTLLVGMHHIVVDGWSLRVVVDDLARAYSEGALPASSATRIDYVDYSSWERGQDFGKSLAFWREHLAGKTAPLELPVDFSRPPFRSGRGGVLHHPLDAELLAKVSALAAARGTTPFVVLLAALGVLLSKHAGPAPFSIGTPVANRAHPDLESIVGFFVNMVPLRVDVGSRDTRGNDLIARLSEETRSAFVHETVPFAQLVEAIDPERDTSRSPLFQVAFALQNFPASKLDFRGLEVATREVTRDASQFDLSFRVFPTVAGATVEIEYSTDLYLEASIERIARQFAQIAQGIVDAPDARVRDYSPLSAADEKQILESFNGTAETFEGGFIPDLFASQAAKTPDAIAVVFEGFGWTYREFDRRTLQLAHRLKNRGVAPGELVAVCLERSFELVVALYAVLRAGAAYVPIDPEYPEARIRFMLEDAAAPVVLSSAHVAKRLDLDASAVVVVDASVEWDEPATPIPLALQGASLAYMIYTSGSTGKPKGAMNTHEGIRNRLLWACREYPLAPDDIVLQKTPYSFDVSVWEFFWPLIVGATLVVARPGGHREPAYLAELIRTEKITTLHFVPSMLRLFLDEPRARDRASLRRVFCSGEALPLDLQRAFFRTFPTLELHNLYGPTEAAIEVSAWTCKPEDKDVPIGHPIANTKLLVLDSEFRLVPIGVPGELCLAGVQLARGYLARPSLTADRFIPNPFPDVPGERLYRTGDLARVRPDGAVDYLGRIDHQVKLRGFRIELGEIESLLAAIPAVRDVVVLVREDQPGDQRLVAYVVPREPSEPPAATDLKAQLAVSLPDYMVPAHVVFLPALPLSPNGKVDRKVLPPPELDDAVEGEADEAPQTPTELKLAGLFASLLHRTSIGRRASFLDLGGHSLLAMRLAAALRDTFQVEIPLRAVFETPSLLALAKRVDDAKSVRFVPIPRAGDGPFPLSFSQERLFFLEELGGLDHAYHLPALLRIEGDLDVGALRRAFERLADRHPVLRSRFSLQGGAPVQADIAWPSDWLEVHDASEWSDDVRRRRLDDHATKPFDLANEPPVRALLLQTRGGWLFSIVFHHIVSDGWSTSLALRDLEALYRGKDDELPALPARFVDFAAWQRSPVRTAERQSHLDYWRDTLRGAPTVLELPTDFPRPPKQTYRGHSRTLIVPHALVLELEAVALHSGASLFMVLLSAFYVWLSKHTSKRDLVVGSPTAGRAHPDTQELLGFFVNTIPLRASWEEGDSFDALLQIVKKRTLDGIEHDDLPFPALLEALDLQRDLARSPLFQVLFAQQNLPPLKTFADLPIEDLRAERHAAQFDLALYFSDAHLEPVGGRDIAIVLEANAALFSEATTQRFLDRFLHLLQKLPEHARRQKPLAELDAIPEGEAAELRRFNASDEVFEGGFIPELLAVQAAKTPDATALVFEGKTWSYRELDRHTLQLAHRLKNRGVAPGELVAVCLERSFELVVALHAIVRAGAAYVPIDPEYPEARIRFMLDDARAALVLSSAHVAKRLDLDPKTVVLVDASVQWDEPTTPIPLALQGTSLAYMIYTSGSTGKPKGAMNSHEGMRNRLLWMQRAFPLTPSDVVLQKTPYSFDVSVWEFFWPLLVGASLVVAKPGGHQDPAYLADIIREQNVSTLHFVPSMLRLFLDEPKARQPSDLARVFCSGEALPIDLQKAFFEAFPDLALVNLYGPTEAAIDVSVWCCKPDENHVPIGVPVANTKLFVLDQNLQTLPIGVPGELFLGGIQLARGYLGRPDLTAERFVPNPFAESPGERLYRTGDLARVRPDGAVDYLGRIDHQVKLRGFRIELGEIESLLAAIPAVRDVVVLAREDRPGDQRLVAYVVPREQDADVSANDLKAELAVSLPDYMVPAHVVFLPALPLSPNGKVDRKLLPAPELGGEADDGDDVPQTATELRLAGLFAALLHRTSIGRSASFLDLGGHSLLAMRLAAAIREVFHVELPLRAVFETPSLLALARRIDDTRQAELAPIPRLADETGPFSLSFSQERLFFLEQLGGLGDAYHLASILRIDRALDVDTLRDAFRRLAERHPILRARFVAREGAPSQTLVAWSNDWLDVRDATDANDSDRRAQLEAHAARSFDLAHEPPARALLLRTGDAWLLSLVFHHIVSDGWSLGLALRDLEALYRGKDDELPSLPVRFVDFAAWQRSATTVDARQTHLDYWRDTLRGAPAVLELPTDFPRPPKQTYRGHAVSRVVPHDLLAELEALALGSGASLFMVLLSAFYVWLSKHTSKRDLVVGSPTAGRAHPDTQELLGFFVNAIPLRASWEEGDSFDALLQIVKKRTLDGIEHDDLPFPALLEALDLQRDLARSPLFQVLFAQQNLPPLKTFADLPIEDLRAERHAAQFDLALYFSDAHLEPVGGRDIAIVLEANAALFSEATTQRFLDRFLHLLQKLPEHARRQKPLAELDAIPEGEAAELRRFNASDEVFEGGFIPELLAVQAAKTPDATALVFEGKTWSYRELDRHTLQLAHRLKNRGVAPGELVAVCLERSFELVVALHAIVRAGAAYVPIDPEYPEARIRFMLDDARAALVLSSAHVAKRLDLDPKTVVLVDASVQWDEPTTPIPLALQGTSLAYMIYTSGSTGKPKGAMNSHEGMRNRLLWMQRAFPLTPSDVVLQKTPYSFDVSVWEFFWPLLVGASLVVAKPGGHQDPAYLADIIREQNVSTLHFVPSMLRLFLDEPKARQPSDLARVFCSGEALPIDLQKAFFEAFPDLALVNLYGPTEAAIDVSVWCCKPDENHVPIGVPVANTKLFVLDQNLQTLPIGVPGELFLGGIQLARGYLGRPDLTAERFVPNPFAESPGERLYRTGDLARVRPDGAVDYLGRIDHQVKLRGFRIELGEIESLLAAIPAVRDVVVLAREDRPGDQRLVAYVVPREQDADVSANDLKAELAVSLPDYMVPAHVVFLPALPLSPNGKVDRKLLPAPELGGEADDGDDVPQTATELRLAGLFAALLHRTSIGRSASFLDLGGHSLLAMRLAAAIREVFHVELPLRAVFETPSLLALARRIDDTRQAELAPIPRLADETGPFSLSFSQERLFFLEQLGGLGDAYHLASILRIDRALDVDTLRDAFRRLAERHPILRARFVAREGAPSQTLVAWSNDWLDVRDATDANDSDRRAQLEAHAARSFDLAHEPPARALLLRTGDAWLLSLVFHHIVSDGWSLGLALRDLEALYRGKDDELPSLPVRFVDFAAWQRSATTVDARQTHLDYWRDTLRGAPAVLELPTDFPRPPKQTYRGHAVSRVVPHDLLAELEALALGSGASLFMVLLSAFYVWLSKHTSKRDLVVGSPTAGRAHPDTQELLGFFVNAIPLRASWEEGDSFDALLQIVKKRTLDGIEHDDLPFPALLEALDLQRDLARSPLFQVLFAQQNLPPLKTFADLPIEDLRAERHAAQFDLALYFSDAHLEPVGGRDIAIVLEANAALFSEATTQRFLDRFLHLLQKLPEHAWLQKPLAELDAIPEGEAAELRRFNASDEVFEGGFIPELLAVQAAKTPDATALVFEGKTWSYRELDRHTLQLAHRLKNRGVAPGELVAVCLERSFELVVALHAIVRAGAAYVPIDPEYPEARIRFMLDDARAALVLSSAHVAKRLDLDPKTVVLVDASVQWDEPTTPIPLALQGTSLAYMIYTSGSTGKPKGAMNSHEGMRNRLLWMQRAFPLTSSDVVLQKTPYSFDVSVWEFFWPLLVGASLVVAKPGGHQDPAYLADIIREQNVSTLHFVPSMLRLFLDEPKARQPSDLARVFCSGEALPIDLQKAFFEAFPDLALVNLYGPTEAAIDVSVWCCKPDENHVPIGVPVANTKLFVLDQNLQTLPIGVPGELFLGGIQLARGYLGRPDLTAERFVPNPFAESPGERLYRTGDLARVRPDGAVDYLGRIDHQVKLRGFRIELGEIESLLAAIPAVRDVVVLAREDRPGDQRLVAYVVPREQDADVSANDLKAELAVSLPDYMVPAHVVFLPALPLSPNGKVDRKLLPAPELDDRHAAGGLAPLDPFEVGIAEVWRDVLGLDRAIVRTDDFFALGGHSLLAMRAAARLQQTFRQDVPVARIFARPILAELASELRASSGATPWSPPTRAEATDGGYLLSFGQQSLWLLAELDPKSTHYNIHGGVDLHGALDVATLRAAIATVTGWHDVLRTSFVSTSAGERAVVHADAKVRLVEHDLIALPEAEQRERLADLQSKAAGTIFDLTKAPLFEVVIVRTSPSDFVWLMTIHHIVGDGWSMQVLYRDVVEAYEALRGGETPVPRPRLDYVDYAAWQRRQLTKESLDAHAAFWREELAGAPTGIRWPGATRSSGRRSARTVPIAISRQTRDGLVRVAREQGTTLFVTLLTAFSALLGSHSGNEDVVIGTPLANRTDDQFVDTVGYFVNALPVRLRPERGVPFRLLLDRARDTFLRAIRHQEYPFEKLVEALRPPRELGSTPIFQVMFGLMNLSGDLPSMNDVAVSIRESSLADAKFDLTVGFRDGDDGLLGVAEYDATLLGAASLDTALARFTSLLDAIAADGSVVPSDVYDGPIGKLLWATVGDLAALGPEDAVQVAAELEELLGLRVTARLVLDAKTHGALADSLQRTFPDEDLDERAALALEVLAMDISTSQNELEDE